MSSFHDRIREKLTEPPRRSSADELPAEFEAVFLDFIEGLKAAHPALAAVIETRGRVHRLVTFPMYRPDEDFTALRFRWTGSALRIATGDDGDFDEVRTPEDLREYLLRFLGDAEFREAIEAYEEVSKEDVPALLYNESSDLLSAEVVLIEVKADDQKRILKATPGEKLTIRVRPRKDPNGLTRRYDGTSFYRWLKSGSYELPIAEHHPEGSEIVLVVEATADDE